MASSRWRPRRQARRRAVTHQYRASRSSRKRRPDQDRRGAEAKRGAAGPAADRCNPVAVPAPVAARSLEDGSRSRPDYWSADYCHQDQGHERHSHPREVVDANPRDQVDPGQQDQCRPDSIDARQARPHANPGRCLPVPLNPPQRCQTEPLHGHPGEQREGASVTGRIQRSKEGCRGTHGSFWSKT
jgi:hypothetical protein